MPNSYGRQIIDKWWYINKWGFILMPESVRIWWREKEFTSFLFMSSQHFEYLNWINVYKPTSIVITLYLMDIMFNMFPFILNAIVFWPWCRPVITRTFHYNNDLGILICIFNLWMIGRLSYNIIYYITSFGIHFHWGTQFMNPESMNAWLLP